MLRGRGGNGREENGYGRETLHREITNVYNNGEPGSEETEQTNTMILTCREVRVQGKGGEERLVGLYTREKDAL